MRKMTGLWNLGLVIDPEIEVVNKMFRNHHKKVDLDQIQILKMFISHFV